MDDGFAREADAAIQRLHLRLRQKPEPRKTPEDFGIPAEHAVAAQLYAMYAARNPQHMTGLPSFLGENDAIDKGDAGWGR